MHINGIPVRYAGQLYGTNYAEPYPGEHVHYFVSLEDAREELRDLYCGAVGDTIILWRVDSSASEAEVISATCTDAAEADYLLERGPRGGITTERI